MVNKTSDDPLEKLAKLSEQERKVLQFRCKGLDYKTIGNLLHISIPHVKQCMQRIYVKLGIDIIPTAERMKTIYQVYCPLLESPELPPARPENEEVEGISEPVPPDVVEMVDEDEYLIVHVKPQPLVTIPEARKKRPWALIWVTVALILGICLGATGGIYIGRFDFNTLPFMPQPTATITQTSIPLPTATAIPSATVELPTQTPIIIQQTVVIVITTTPLPPTPLPTATNQPLVTLPFEDTFDLRARPEWQTSTGTWRVVDGHFTAEIDSWQIAFVGDYGWRNHKIEVTTFSKDFVNPIRIIARAGKNGYIAFEFYSYGARWFIEKNGDEQQIADLRKSFDYDRTYKIVVEVKDDIYTAYIDDIQLLQIQDTTFSNGRVGIGYTSSYLTWFDDFRVTELP